MYALTDLQIALMQVLWDRGESTVVEVQEDLLPERPLAQSTVATLLGRMEKKGLVSHRTEGRQYVYRAEVSEDAVRSTVVSEFKDLTSELFAGDVAAMVSQLLSTSEIEADDLARVRAMIEAREAELRRGE